MENRIINIVWCDDKIDTLDNESTRESFENYNCKLFKKAHTSEELSTILKEHRDLIDAVIVDFNMSDKDLIPGEAASGFRWVHEHVQDYIPIPFYLYSARDVDFIKQKYEAFEYDMKNDYFFTQNSNVSSKRNRHFMSGELDDMLRIIEEEVETLSMPSFKVRMEYSKAFNAIERHQLDSALFIRILTSDDSVDRYDLCDLANPLRKVIEGMVAQLQDAEIIPKCELNKMPELLQSTSKYPVNDRMPRALGLAFDFFIKLTQDGSHDKKDSKFEFHQYLRKTGDVYIVKALAIIGLDIITWMSQFYDKYQDLKPFHEDPFTVKVSKLVNVNGQDGAIAIHKGKKYFIAQPPFAKYRYEVGSNVEIDPSKIQTTTPEFGDFYCIGRNLDVK